MFSSCYLLWRPIKRVHNILSRKIINWRAFRLQTPLKVPFLSVKIFTQPNYTAAMRKYESRIIFKNPRSKFENMLSTKVMAFSFMFTVMKSTHIAFVMYYRVTTRQFPLQIIIIMRQ